MLFGNRKRTKEIERKKWEYESAIKTVYQYECLTLAMCRMSFFEGYNLREFSSGEFRNYADEFEMFGVIHEESSISPRVLCDLKFHDEQIPDGENIGWCSLSEYDPLKLRSPSAPEQAALMLDVNISDGGHHFARRAYEILRDAAISGNRFIHIGLVTVKGDALAAAAQMRERRYGPTKKVSGLRMWPQIVLPNAPQWGWARDI